MTAKLTSLSLCGLLLAAPALAEVTDAQHANTQAVWLTAFDDWGPAFTCGATMGASDDFVRKVWLGLQQDALATMQMAGWPEDELAELRAKGDPDALRLPLDTPFADVLTYCAAHPEWLKKAMTMGFLPLATEVEKALSGGTP